MMDRRMKFTGCIVAVLSGCGTTTSAPKDASADVMSDAPPSTATASTCNAWLAAQRETDLPVVTGDNAKKRAALLTAGGGYRKIDDTYYAAWFSAGHFSASKRRVIFVLHGTTGAPEYEFADWQAPFDAQGYAFVGLRWYYEGKTTPDDYSNAETLYKRMVTILDEMDSACGTKTADVSLLGFSRGSAQSFEVLARDRAGQKRLKGVIANAGAWPTTSKPTDYLVALDTKGDTTAMAGGQMWMYCGAKDIDDSGEARCKSMTGAKAWVEKHGGTVQKLYEDPNGEHHSMPGNAAAIAEAFAFVNAL